MMRVRAAIRPATQPPALPGVMWFGLRTGAAESFGSRKKPPAEPGADGIYFGKPRRGVTLIELLVTIMIISILAAAVLGVAAVAGETAREAKTRAIIGRLHSLLMEHYDSYTNRRIKLRREVVNQIAAYPGNASGKGRLKAEARLYALRELMLMEVPDRWSDVTLVALPSSDTTTLTSFDKSSATYVASPLYLDVSGTQFRRTELAAVYLRNFDRLTKTTNKITNSLNRVGDIRTNESAECLYLVIMNACGDGEARTLIPESSIGDTDGDGAPEFLDGWGQPISFVRWAPGFESDIQINANELINNDDWASAGSSDHDPYDLYRTHSTAYRLVPLIVSPGRDEELGLFTQLAPPVIPWVPSSSVNLSLNQPPPYVTPALNPYVSYSSNYLGTADNTKTDVDNLHNHLIRTR